VSTECRCRRIHSQNFIVFAIRPFFSDSHISSLSRHFQTDQANGVGVLGFELADAVFQLLNGRSNIGGIELLRDMLGAIHVPGFNREQDRLFRPRVVTFRHEPREQLRIVRDEPSSIPYFDPAPGLGLL
jgi:hypothetical protein